MGFLFSKVDRDQDAAPAGGSKGRRSEEPEIVTHKPSDERESRLSQTPRLLRAIREGK